MFDALGILTVVESGNCSILEPFMNLPLIVYKSRPVNLRAVAMRPRTLTADLSDYY